MHCKNIRNDEGYWIKLENFMQKHYKSSLSHGICDDCMKKYYSEFSKKI